jgi:superfamily II DNA helicase RecQ
VQVQDDIVQQLGFGAGAVRLMSSFDRPNIHYCVRYADTLPHEVVNHCQIRHSLLAMSIDYPRAMSQVTMSVTKLVAPGAKVIMLET